MDDDGTRVFIGIDRRTGQYMVYYNDEIKLARTVVRVPEVEKWEKEALAAIKVTPWHMHEARQPEVIFKDRVEVERDDLEVKPSLARQVYIRHADLDRYGMTRGCPKCDSFVK